jgi:hypothetical protein
VSHILDRLQILPPTSTGASQTLVYSPPPAQHLHDTTSGAVKAAPTAQISAILDVPPPILIPVNIARRRRSNAEDVKNAIDGLNLTSLALKSATANAEKITNLLFMSVGSLSSIAKRYAALRQANYSKPRLLWIAAIRRVIIQNAVAKYTVMINNFEQKLKTKQLLTAGPSSNRMSLKRVSGMTKAREI